MHTQALRGCLSRQPPLALALGHKGELLAVLGLCQGPATHSLSKLQAAMLRHVCSRPLLVDAPAKVVAPASWCSGAQGAVLDGDLLGLFLELDWSQQESLCRSSGLAPSEVAQLVDTLLSLCT